METDEQFLSASSWEQGLLSLQGAGGRGIGMGALGSAFVPRGGRRLENRLSHRSTDCRSTVVLPAVL